MLDYFDKIYVLSLKRNTQRRQIVKDRLSKVGLDFEFFDACDGQVFDHIWKKLENPNFTTKNYVACQISHLQIYNDALSQGYKRILILEDDVKPHKDIVNIFENYKSQIPDDYDLLYLGWIPLNDDCSMWDYSQINDRFITKNLFHSKNLWGLYAYSPSVELMKEMVDLYNRDFPMEFQDRRSDSLKLFDAPTVRKLDRQSRIVAKHLQSVSRGIDFIVLWLDCDKEGENICFEVLDICRHNIPFSKR